MRTLDKVVLPGQSVYDQSQSRFRLAVDWIKALPGGVESDFILVSCAGVLRPGWFACMRVGSFPVIFQRSLLAHWGIECAAQVC
jgi:hypothetical protein